MILRRLLESELQLADLRKMALRVQQIMLDYTDKLTLTIQKLSLDYGIVLIVKSDVSELTYQRVRISIPDDQKIATIGFYIFPDDTLAVMRTPRDFQPDPIAKLIVTACLPSKELDNLHAT